MITVMLLATVMTIVLSVSFKSSTDVQITKLEEESQKALAAAESAIEVALKENGSVTIGSGSLSSITGFEGSATIESASDKTFSTQIIQKDNSYTFYLGNYDLESKVITPVSDPNNLTVCFQTTTPNPAIEITLVKTSGIKKYVVDPAARISGATSGTPPSCPSGYSYSTNVLASDIGADGQFLLVRVLYAPTKLYFSRSTNLPIQGRTASSEATSSTSTGVSKKIVLFQSYPQIPGEFFSTSF